MSDEPQDMDKERVLIADMCFGELLEFNDAMFRELEELQKFVEDFKNRRQHMNLTVEQMAQKLAAFTNGHVDVQILGAYERLELSAMHSKGITLFIQKWYKHLATRPASTS
uniref:POU-specific domain-containing protein n=1 Tax=Steinernema glaseri TaxID=37863 RepID=A0A1I8AGL5_9BILA